MNTEILDFSKRYREVTAHEADIVIKKALLLSEKRERLSKAIDNLETSKQRIVKSFRKRISSYDSVTRAFIEYRLDKLLAELDEPYKSVQYSFIQQLKDIDFFSKYNREELLKKSPFKKQFDEVNDFIAYFKDCLEGLQKALEGL